MLHSCPWGWALCELCLYSVNSRVSALLLLIVNPLILSSAVSFCWHLVSYRFINDALLFLSWNKMHRLCESCLSLRCLFFFLNFQVDGSVRGVNVIRSLTSTWWAVYSLSALKDLLGPSRVYKYICFSICLLYTPKSVPVAADFHLLFFLQCLILKYVWKAATSIGSKQPKSFAWRRILGWGFKKKIRFLLNISIWLPEKIKILCVTHQHHTIIICKKWIIIHFLISLNIHVQISCLSYIFS